MKSFYYENVYSRNQLHISGLYYKRMTIVNDYSRVVNKLETSLTDDARVVIYDRRVFIVQATGLLKIGKQRQWKRIS